MAEDDETPAPTRLAAMRDVLDRVGISAKTSVEIDVNPAPWEEMFTRMAGGSRAESRAARGLADDTILDADADADADVIGEDALDPMDSPAGVPSALPAVPQPDLDPGVRNTGASNGAGSNTGAGTPGSNGTSDLSRSLKRVSFDLPGHPEDVPRRKNPAITPPIKRPRRLN